MKKLAVLAAIATVASVNAAETKMKVTGRFDYLNTDSKFTETGSADEKSTSGEYKTSYLRWKTTSKFNETTTAELTLNFAEAATGINANNTLTNFVDTAYLTKSFGNGFSVMVGKQAVLVGGRENDWSSADMYGKTAFNSSLPSNLVGLTAGYEVAGQTFYLQHLEGENDANVDTDSDSENDKQSLTDKKVVGFAYYGDFMEGMVKPIASYHKIGTNTAGNYDVVMALGAQFNWQAATFELDYLSRTNENGGTNSNNTTADREETAIVAHARYAMDMWRPFAKYTMESVENDTDARTDGFTKTKRNLMEVGLEIVPNKDEDFRYHVVYSAATTEADEKIAGNTDTFKDEETKIYAGIKFGLAL